MLRVRESMEIEDRGHRMAMVQKAMIEPLRERWTVKVDGPDLHVQGNIVDHEYTIERDGQRFAEVSKRWFRVRDTYGVEVAPGENDILILATTAVIDTMAHPGSIALQANGPLLLGPGALAGRYGAVSDRAHEPVVLSPLIPALNSRLAGATGRRSAETQPPKAIDVLIGSPCSLWSWASEVAGELVERVDPPVTEVADEQLAREMAKARRCPGKTPWRVEGPT